MTWTSFRKLTLLGFALLCLNACAPDKKFAGSADPAEGIPEEGGFFSADDERMPAAVRAASSSVFQILVPTNQVLEDVETAFGMGQAYRYSLLMTEPDPLLRAVLSKQVEFCEIQQGFFNGQGRKCRISKSFNKGSGFLLGDGKTLWTAAHILDNAFAPKDVAPVFVADKDGNLQFDPYTEPPLISRPNPTSTEPQVDYARLALGKEIGKPLTAATQAPTAGQEIFAVGFPSCTACEPAAGKIYDRSARKTGPDANGKDQRISRGRPYKISRAPLIDTSVDVMPGNSGGPGLNKEGQVFGIAILAGNTQFAGKTHRLGVFVAPPEWRR